ncbi:MAG: hypothetical protein IJ594_05890 [Oscillospiraceae bacterium]|nr:hypothetical protein [Oscillospiraceae bacterium]
MTGLKRKLKTLRTGSPGFVLLQELLLARDGGRAALAAGAQTYARLHGPADGKEVARAMRSAYIHRGITPDEFIDFAFMDKSEREKAAFVSIEELLRVFSRGDKNTFPGDKYERYLLFPACFHRELLCVRFDGSAEEAERVRRFLAAHGTFFLKPLKGTKGHGVQKLTAAQAPDLAALAARAPGGCLLEEPIVQGEELAHFHPGSVNTLRLATVRDRSGDVHPLFAVLRIGAGDSVVDNVGAGGVVCLVDTETGTVVTDGLNRHLYHARHPDTGVPFKGARIPQWPELLAIAREAHATLPRQALIGWDFAWTTGGWDLVESNPAPSFASCQALAGKGIRPRLEAYGLL